MKVIMNREIVGHATEEETLTLLRR